jgi:WD40 repeat protein
VTVSLWNVTTAERITRFSVPAGAAFLLTFAPDGKTLLGSGPEPQVRLWDTVTGQQVLAEAGHAGAITSLSFTPDGRALVSGADDGTLRVWDVATARLRRPLPGHRRGVHALAVSPDGKAVLSGGGDGCLRLHDLDKGEERRRFVIDKQPQAPGEAEYQVRSLVLATDGGTAASWSAKSLREPALFQVWDLATGEALVRRADPWVRRSNPWGSGARLFSPDAKLVLSCLATTAGGDAMPAVMASSGTPAHFGPCTVDLRDVATGRPILPLPQPDTYGYVQAFAPDGRTLVTATGKMPETEAVPSDHHALHLWELATGKERLTIAPGETGREYRFEQVAFAPDGRALATARADGTLQLWDLATGAALLSRAGYCARVTCLALSPDSRVLASGHADGTILLWELTSGRRAAGRPAAKPDAGQLDRWWGDLAGEDARKAGAAIDGLCAVPERTVTLLRDRLRPAPAVPADEIRRRIADLDSDAFERREAASADLAALGDQARAAMQAVLQANPSVELRRRAETLLADSGIARSAETRRALRAVEMLERVGSPEARQILEALGQGAPDARQTREVKAALARLSRR